MKKPWYEMQLQAGDETVAEIHVIDIIGDWIDQMINEWLGTKSPITAKQFVDDLAALPDSVKTIRVHINSPGGDVMGALNIANALRDQRTSKGRTVETIVDGLAASSASLIAMAGSPLRMADNALLMIHEPWTAPVGNSAELRKTADVLDQVRDGQIIPTYQWHTPLSAEELRQLMADETWMDAPEAIERGFADEVVAGLQAAAAIDPRAAAKLRVPEKYAERVKALLRPEAPVDPPAPEPEPASARVEPPAPPAPPAAMPADEVLAACAEAGLDLGFARALLGEALTTPAVAARIGAEQERRVAAGRREAEIRALCAKFGHDDLAAGYVSSGMALDTVKDHLSKIVAKVDRVEIDAGLKPDHGAKRGPAIDVVAIYAERNKPRLVQ